MKHWPKLHRAFELRESSNPMEWRVKRGSLPDYQHAGLLLGDNVHNVAAPWTTSSGRSRQALS